MIYSTQAAFETYLMFLALSRHFTSNYDYIKYNGKVKANPESFEKRKDKYFFYKLSKKQNPKNFIIANLLENEKIWIGEMLTQKGEHIYNDWMKKTQSLSYSFSNEIEKLDDDIDEQLKIYNGQHPKLFNLFLSREISIESLIILNELLHFFPYWNKKLDVKLIWEPVHFKCTKYKPFLTWNRLRMKSILLNRFG